jgi:hypothetical protein
VTFANVPLLAARGAGRTVIVVVMVSPRWFAAFQLDQTLSI